MTCPGRTVTGGIDHRLTHVDLGTLVVRPEFSGDGREHRTGNPVGGAAALAGSREDGPAFGGFQEGRNPFWDGLSKLVYTCAPRLRDVQAPKGMVVGGRALDLLGPYVARRGPIQLLRIGPLYLIGIPAEVTVVAGLRLRRTVAAIVGADPADVLVAGYSNGYLHYVTTPEEYDTQQYEGGSTLFGRWTLPGLQQVAAGLATAMREDVPAPYGDPEPDLSHRQREARPASRPRAPAGSSFGDGLHLTELTFTKSPTGWTGTFRIEAPTDPRRLDGIGETMEFVVRQQRRMVGRAVLTATAEPRSTRPGVRVHVDLRGCAGPVPTGTIVLYGQLVPGKHPLTIFAIQVT